MKIILLIIILLIFNGCSEDKQAQRGDTDSFRRGVDISLRFIISIKHQITVMAITIKQLILNMDNLMFQYQETENPHLNYNL